MKVIVGLGNPGAEYERTRHNVGWWAVEKLADAWGFGAWKKDGAARVATGTVAGSRVRLVKQMTFMNLSGDVLSPYQRRAAWSASTDLLVIVDDAAIGLGSFRLRAKGSAGGHNGLKSIEQALHSQEYARLRIGIQPGDERKVRGRLADFVLDEFGEREERVVRDLLPKVVEAVETWVTAGVEVAMSRHNSSTQ